MKAIVKYPGSKWSIANWIISFFPKHHSYLEPFFGSGAVLFNKPRSNIETSNNLEEAICCFVLYGEYDAESIWKNLEVHNLYRQARMVSGTGEIVLYVENIRCNGGIAYESKNMV